MNDWARVLADANTALEDDREFRAYKIPGPPEAPADPVLVGHVGVDLWADPDPWPVYLTREEPVDFLGVTFTGRGRVTLSDVILEQLSQPFPWAEARRRDAERQAVADVVTSSYVRPPVLPLAPPPPDPCADNWQVDGVSVWEPLDDYDEQTLLLDRLALRWHFGRPPLPPKALR